MSSIVKFFFIFALFTTYTLTTLQALPLISDPDLMDKFYRPDTKDFKESTTQTTQIPTTTDWLTEFLNKHIRLRDTPSQVEPNCVILYD